MGIDVEAPLARTPVRHSVGVSEPREGKLAKLTGHDEASRRVSTGIVDNSGSAAARRAPAQPREGEASRRESTLEASCCGEVTGDEVLTRLRPSWPPFCAAPGPLASPAAALSPIARTACRLWHRPAQSASAAGSLSCRS